MVFCYSRLYSLRQLDWLSRMELPPVWGWAFKTDSTLGLWEEARQWGGGAKQIPAFKDIALQLFLLLAKYLPVDEYSRKISFFLFLNYSNKICLL